MYIIKFLPWTGKKTIELADLSGAKGKESALAQTIIVPAGVLTVWKKLRNNVIAELQIPANAKRSNGSGRKCRFEFAVVVSLSSGTTGYSLYAPTFVYSVGETVKCDKWCEDRWQTCGGGIHAFLTREEAEAFEM